MCVSMYGRINDLVCMDVSMHACMWEHIYLWRRENPSHRENGCEQTSQGEQACGGGIALLIWGRLRMEGDQGQYCWMHLCSVVWQP